MARSLGSPGPTRRGWTLAGASAALVVGGRVVGSLGLVGLGLAGLLLVVFAVLSVAPRAPAVEARRFARPSRVHVGGEGRVVLEGATTARTPLLALTEYVDGGRRAARFVLPPGPAGTPVEAVYRVPTEQRGLHELGPLVGIVGDPLGLARRSWELLAATDLVVRPRLHDVLAPGRGGGGEQDPRAEGPRVPAFEASGDFLALRDYESGDDPRRVHWRSSARRGHLVVRQDEAAAPGRVVVLLDTRPWVHDLLSFEIAVEAVASIALRLDHDDAPVEVLTSSGLVLARPGPGTLELLMDRLAVVEATEPDLLAAVGSRLARRLGVGAVVACTGTPDDALVDAIAAVGRRAELTIVAARAPDPGVVARVPTVDVANGALAAVWNRFAAVRRTRRAV